jgi:transposase
MPRRQRRTYSKEFKQQIVDLYLAGKPCAGIIREYELTPSSFDKWMKQAQSTGSFKEKRQLNTRTSRIDRTKKEK